MTTFDLINYYQFNLISSKYQKHPSGICTMVEEMNSIREKYRNGDPIDDVLIECVKQRHQNRIPNDVVKDAKDALKKSVFVDAQLKSKPLIVGNRLSESFTDFEELYDFVRSSIGNITGIGPLTVYDTAKRIGHLFDTPIYPKPYVYLSAGALDGAKVLLGRNDLKFRELTTLFEPYFGTFPSIFIEDILCIFKDKFGAKSTTTTVTTPILTKANGCFYCR